MTGRLPDAHGVTNTGQRLRADEVTLAERLSAAGYRTVAACSIPNGGSSFGNAQGFDEFHELWIPSGPDDVDHVIERTGEAFKIPSAADVAAFAAQALAEPSDEPLFLYLHVLEPHTPFQAPDAYLDRWVDPGYDGPFDAASGDDMQVFYDVMNDRLEATAADIEQVRGLYDGNLAWADHNVGVIREHFERAGLWNDALVVITSDHGEACWQHGEWGHNWELYDEFVNVPLVIKLPDHEGPRGAVLDELVSTTDVVPTLIEYVDLPLGRGPSIDGRSLMPLLNGAAGENDRELILRTHHKIPHLGLRTPTTKTIVRQSQVGAIQAVEHYRLDADPHEREDVFDASSPTLRAEAKRLREWYVEAARTRSSEAMELTTLEATMLERLGYAGD